MKDLNLLHQKLADAGLDFVVIGGYAGVLHGSWHVTCNLEICVLMNRENVARLRMALADLHPVHRMTHQKLSFIRYPPADQDVANLYLETDGGIVDVLGTVLGVGDYTSLRQHAVEVTLFGRRCWVMSLEDLIRAKEALGREKDLLTAKELRAIAAKRRQGNAASDTRPVNGWHGGCGKLFLWLGRDYANCRSLLAGDSEVEIACKQAPTPIYTDHRIATSSQSVTWDY